MTPDVESARHEWGDAYRRLEEASGDAALAERMRAQLEVVTDELRIRIGSTFTLGELAGEYRHADAWVRHVVAERAATPGWLGSLSLVEGAAFHLYARGAADYTP